MKRIFKFLFVGIILIFLILSLNIYCFAINMNLSFNNVNSENSIDEPYNDDNTIADNLNTQENAYINSPTSPSVVTTTAINNDNFLTVDNIIAIILIAIGIVLILFAIAIFVRFK